MPTVSPPSDPSEDEREWIDEYEVLSRTCAMAARTVQDMRQAFGLVPGKTRGPLKLDERSHMEQALRQHEQGRSDIDNFLTGTAGRMKQMQQQSEIIAVDQRRTPMERELARARVKDLERQMDCFARLVKARGWETPPAIHLELFAPDRERGPRTE